VPSAARSTSSTDQRPTAAACGGPTSTPWLDTVVHSVDYVVLYVDDLDASLAFYRDVLGLPFKFQESGYAEFATPGTKFALYDRRRLPGLIGRDASEGGPAGEVLFLVDDVDKMPERLRGLGVEILAGPVDRPWGHRTLHVRDPDGFVVELAEEIPRQEPREG
jgi:lactoylglutathione lyase